MKISEVIYSWRQVKGYTIREAAAMADMDKMTWWRLEMDLGVSGDTMAKIVKFLLS